MKDGQSFDTDALISYNDFSDKINNRISCTGNDVQQNFEGLKKFNIFKDGFNRVENGYSEVNQSVQNYRKVLNNYSDDLSSFEKKGIDYVEGIKVPKTYSLNDVIFNYEEEQVKLSKTDGKSVNEGKLDNNSNDINILEDGNKEKLENISNEESNAKEYDDSVNIVKEQLNDMSNNHDERAKELNDNYSINSSQALGDINNSQETQKQELNDNYSNNVKENLEDIDKNQTLDKKELEDDYFNEVKTNLEDVDNNQVLYDKKLEDDYFDMVKPKQESDESDSKEESKHEDESEK